MDWMAQTRTRDVLLIIVFSLVTPYAYIWLMGYLVAYSPLQAVHTLFSEPSSTLVVVSLSVATLVHSMLLAALLVGPFGYLVSSTKWVLLVILLVVVLIQVHVFPPGRAVSLFMWIDYLSFVVCSAAAFYLGSKVRKSVAKTRST